MPVTHMSADADASELSTILARDGAVIVDDLISADEMDVMLGEMQPYVDATPLGPDDFSGRATKRTGALIARSPAAREMVMHPLVLGTTAEVLSHATNHQIHLTQIIAIGPGQEAQPIHRDQWAFDFFSFPQGYEVQCNTIWAGTDFTEANGATRVVVGSNQLEDKLRFPLEDSEPAEMSKGSVLIYTGSVYHGGGHNQTDETRIGVNITYNVAWLRQEENQYLTTPLEKARELPDELLKLMGYQRGAYALGYVDDLRDPIDVVRPGQKKGLGDNPLPENVLRS